MGEQTKISWTDHTFNPWWGCQRVSPGCEHCYAESYAAKKGLKIWGASKSTERRFFGDKHWREPLRWDAVALREGIRRRVFCASMADVFEDREDLVAERARLFRLIEATPNLDWLLLTKRPENVIRLAAECSWMDVWPGNVWLGTTCEDQVRANTRIPDLLAAPAAVHFVSYEPALAEVDFRCWLGTSFCRTCKTVLALSHPTARSHFEGRVCGTCHMGAHRALDWVIVGGESGPHARPFDVQWGVRTIRDCKAAGVAVFFKQAGKVAYDSLQPDRHGDPHPDGPAFDPSCRLDLVDPKGGDLAELDEELHVRQWPK